MYPSSGLAWAAWPETSRLAAAMRQWLCPTPEILHIARFVALAGAARILDLRLPGGVSLTL